MTRDELQELFDKANERWAESNETENMPFWDLIVALSDIVGIIAPTEPGGEIGQLDEPTQIEW